MKPFNMNLSKMVKIGQDDNSSTFMHPSGHQIKIAHAGISKAQKDEMEKIPVKKFADGGDSGFGSSNDSQPTPAQAAETVANQEKYAKSFDEPPPRENNDPVFKNDSHDVTMQNGGASGSWDDQNNPNVQSNSTNQASNNDQSQPSNAAPSQQDRTPAAKPLSLQDSLAANQARQNEIFQNMQANREALGQAFADKKIDPNHFFASKDNAHKVLTGIGMLLGGMGGGITHQENPAVKQINAAINNDIEAQKNDQSNTMNLWKMNHMALQDESAANMQSRNALLQAAKAQIDQQQGLLPGSMASLRAQALKGQLDNEIKMNDYKTSYLKNIQQGTGQTADPATELNKRFQMGLITKDQYDQGNKELGTAQASIQNENQLMRHFDDAAKENTIVRTAGGLRTPESILAMNAMELPMIHDKEGRVNEFEQKTVQGLHPQQGDTDQKIRDKRIAYHQFITSKQATPILSGMGINAGTPEIKISNGVKYMRGPNGQAIRVQ